VDSIILETKCCFSKRTLHSRSSGCVLLTSPVFPQTLCLHLLLFPSTQCKMSEYGKETQIKIIT